MDKLIFVCYQHGFGGENLSHRISQHPLCDRLLVKTEKGRTVIKNDIFNKVFLGFNNNFQYNFQDKEKLCIKIIKDFKNKIDKVNNKIVTPFLLRVLPIKTSHTLKKVNIKNIF
jgi:hypothetical protein